jgi:hypothetical protein
LWDSFYDEEVELLPYIHVDGQEVNETNPMPNKQMNSTPFGENDIGQVLNGYQDITVLNSAARSTSGETNEILCGKYKEAVVFVDVTALTSGLNATTLDVKFQTQDPISLVWFDIAELTFTQKTGVSNEMKTKTGLLGSKLRCVYTLGGDAPDVTFSVGLILKS